MRSVFVFVCLGALTLTTCGGGDDNPCAAKLYNSPSMIVYGNSIYISYYSKNKYTDPSASSCTESSTNYDLIFSYSADNGNSWSKKTVVSQVLPPSSAVGLSTQNIAVNSTGSQIFISYLDGSILKCAYSLDSGSTFTSVTVDSDSAATNQALIMDGNGKLYIAYDPYLLTSTEDTSTLYVATSTDSGVTWTTTEVDSTAGTGHSPSMAVDETNQVYVTYYYATTSGGLKYALYNLSAWSTGSVKVGDGAVSGLFSSVIVPPGNTSYVAFYDPNGYSVTSDGYIENTNGTLKFTKSVSPSIVTIDSAAYTGEAVSAGISGNNVYVSYGQYNPSGDINGLKFAKSTNGGSSFTVSSGYIDTDIVPTSTTRGLVYLNSCLKVYTLNSVTTVYIVYVASSGTALKFAKSSDGGGTWSKVTLS
ncbi:MAG: hypothetical protein V1647_03880 [Pseudomonadota bacterium]